MFITLDGVDGGGKSTQISRLREALESLGYEVESVRDPGSTDTGEAIRKILLDSELDMHRRSEAFLYMAARAQLVEERIRPALEQDKIVISDRFLLANVVYQSAAGGESTEQLWNLGAIATAGLRPDLTLLLDLPAEVSMQRLSRPADRMESRGEPYLEAVRQGFLAQVPRAGNAHEVIDATLDADAVTEVIWKAIRKHFPSLRTS